MHGGGKSFSHGTRAAMRPGPSAPTPRLPDGEQAGARLSQPKKKPPISPPMAEKVGDRFAANASDLSYRDVPRAGLQPIGGACRCFGSCQCAADAELKRCRATSTTRSS